MRAPPPRLWLLLRKPSGYCLAFSFSRCSREQLLRLSLDFVAFERQDFDQNLVRLPSLVCGTSRPRFSAIFADVQAGRRYPGRFSTNAPKSTKRKTLTR